MLTDGLVGFALAAACYAICSLLIASTSPEIDSMSSSGGRGVLSPQATAALRPDSSVNPLSRGEVAEAGVNNAHRKETSQRDDGEQLLLLDDMPFPLRRCRKVLLDIGSGGGTMVQRLYDGYANKRGAASFFSEAWREHFALMFGAEDMRHHDVCTVMWEPIDTPRLRKIVGRYQSLGRMVHWFRRPAWATTSAISTTTTDETVVKYSEDKKNISFFYTAPRSFTVKKSNVVRWSYEGTVDSRLEAQLRQANNNNPVFNTSLEPHDLVKLVQEGVSADATVVMVMDAGGSEHRLITALMETGTLCSRVDSLVLQHPNPAHMWMLESDKSNYTRGDFYVLAWAVHQQRCACKTVARMSLPFSWPFNKKVGEDLGVGLFRCHLDSWKNFFYRGGRCLW